MSLPADFTAELRKHFTGDIRTDTATRALYSTDASIYQIEPLGVALPKTQDDLIAAVELAAKYRVPILPRGSGSSLAGQAIGAALILDCSRYLDRLVAIDPASHTATVEPGVILSNLNRAAAHHGLVFGPDPASAERATLGGVIGNNATGAHSIRYGMTADHLVAADVILSDGSLATLGEIRNQSLENREQSVESREEPATRYAAFVSSAIRIREKYGQEIRDGWPRAWRNSGGYRLNYLLPWSAARPPQWGAGPYPPVRENAFNLACLLAGSEGTLAVIRTATLNLVPKPKNTVLAVLNYAGAAAACDAVPDLLKHGPSAVELIPRMLIQLARSVPAYAGQLGFVRGDPAALLVVEFSGDDPAVLRQQARALGAAQGHPDVLIAESASDQASVWAVRKVGLGLLDSRPTAARPVAFIEDCAIPVERLGEFVREVEHILAAHDVQAAFYAHASAGTLHIRPMLDLKTGQGVRALRSIAQSVLALTLRVGGAMSSEHGDGLLRSEWLPQTYGETLVAAFKDLKQAADPHALLNPNKLLDAPLMDTHLRYGTEYSARTWAPALGFAGQGGLAAAIEQCNGQGVCRKDTGLMCPSFQATREEQNSTRGRANLLRGLISFPQVAGRDRGSKTEDRPSSVLRPPSNVTPAHVHAALDLCLACKGCTSECPSGVDMPKLKFEFLHEYHKTHPRPLRDYLFGYFHTVAALLAPLAPLSNAAMQNPLLKGLAASLFTLAPQRPFPRFAGRQAHARRPAAAGRPAVLFLPDAFTHFIEPDVEQAAFDLLDLSGFDVQVLPVIGAGASLLSKGLIEPARRHASRVLDALARLDPHGALPLLGIEPPELYLLKNDYADLLPDREAEIERRAQKAWLPEEFLLRSGALDRWHALKPAGRGNLKFQPHCHQRAEGPADDGLPNGVQATAALLRACGYSVDVLDVGCCGMAGTFGYDAEHYELSMQIGELKLFPEVRAAGDSTIVSTGAACRMQVQQGTGVDAQHPLLLAARAVKEMAGKGKGRRKRKAEAGRKK